MVTLRHTTPARPARLSIVVARAANGVIGRDGRLPWRLPEDLAWFKRQTWGKPVIMGRKTFDSIGRSLPGRRNIVLSRDPDWAQAGVERAGSLAQALALCADAPEAAVIGGAELFAEALPLADCLAITEIDVPVQGDVVFPAFDETQWRIEHEDPRPNADPPFRFTIRTRTSAA